MRLTYLKRCFQALITRLIRINGVLRENLATGNDEAFCDDTNGGRRTGLGNLTVDEVSEALRACSADLPTDSQHCLLTILLISAISVSTDQAGCSNIGIYIQSSL